MSSLPPCVKLTGGKRGAPGPLLVTTSDEDSGSDGETLPQASPRAPLTTRTSPRGNITDTYPNLKLDLSQRTLDRVRPVSPVTVPAHPHGTPSSLQHPSPPSHQHPVPPSHQQQAYEGYEHDHDYENVASPSGSSTASGPVYVRPPGFQHHAQEIRRKKKKSTGLLDLKEGLKKRAPTPPKIKPRRDPLPMRLRALPQSFWKQPNVPNAVSPGNMFSSLPPLSYYTGKDDDVTDIRPITPPDDREKSKKHVKMPDRKIIVTADTDMVLKHLFAGVLEEKKNTSQLKRGRPKKIHMHKSNMKGLLSGDDPYLIDSAITEKLFPQLSLDSGSRQGHGGSSSLQLITLREGDKSVTLPSLSSEQNYSQMLSELVMNI